MFLFKENVSRYNSLSHNGRTFKKFFLMHIGASFLFNLNLTSINWFFPVLNYYNSVSHLFTIRAVEWTLLKLTFNSIIYINIILTSRPYFILYTFLRNNIKDPYLMGRILVQRLFIRLFFCLVF